MVRAFMISFLARQALTRPREEMAARHPHPWLVWEPGAWTAPSPTTRMTLLPPEPGAEKPVQGDSLCFELVLKADQKGLRVGRDQGCDIVINDATVSREHLLLTKGANGFWSAEAVSQSKSTFLGAMALKPGSKVALADGQKLKVGDVVFTHLTPASFFARLTSSATATT